MSDVSFLTVYRPSVADLAKQVAANIPEQRPAIEVKPKGWFDNSPVGASLLVATISAGLVYSIATKLSATKRKSEKPTAPHASNQVDVASPLRTPTDDSVARFCKMEELGRGAFGVVYKGRHYRTGELVAIKEMPAVGGCDELKAEYELVLGLKHENIVNVIAFEVGQRHARLYLEWVAGGSLADMIKKFPITEPLARNYTKQILSGLSFLHQHNIIHRDIKPKNILIDHRGVLKLTDFGLSRHLDSMQDRTRAAGTPVYMAPECVKGQFSVGSDVWAVGATLSEMLTRELPWSHIDSQILQNQMALLYHIASFQGKKGHHPVIPRTVSGECQEFLAVCFSAEPQDRLSCEELLQHPWFTNPCLGREGDSGSTDPQPQSRSTSPTSSQRESTFSQVSTVP